jgi:hypothetical protein
MMFRRLGTAFERQSQTVDKELDQRPPLETERRVSLDGV